MSRSRSPVARNARIGYAFAVLNAVVSGVAVYVSDRAVGVFRDAVLYTSLKNGVVGALLLLPLVASSAERRRFQALGRRDWLWLVLVALIGGSIPYALFYEGLKSTTAVTGALGDHIQFVLVALFAVAFLRERLSPALWAGLGVLCVGVLEGAKLGLVAFNRGTVMILAATLLFSVEWVVVKHLLKGRLAPSTVMTAKMTLGSAMLFAYLALRGELSPIGSLDGTQWRYAVVTGLILLVFTVTIFVAIHFARVSTVMAIGAGAPLVTIVLQSAASGRIDLAGDGLGLVLTLAGVVLILVVGLHQEVSAAARRGAASQANQVNQESAPLGAGGAPLS